MQLKPIPDNVPYNVWYRSKSRKEGKEIDGKYLKSSGRTQAERKTWQGPGIA